MLSLVVVMSVLGIGLCYERFQCDFENENLKFIKNGDSNVWGKPTKDVKPLEFQDEKTLNDFIKKLDQGRRDFYDYNVYDDVATYPTERDFKALSKNGTENIKDKFIIEHVIDMKTAQSTLGQLVKFFSELGLKVNRTIDDHCYLAVVMLEVNGTKNNEKILLEIGSEETWNKYFLEPRNSLVGIIKIKYKEIGYIIINLNDPEVAVPMIFENQNQDTLPNQDKKPAKFYTYYNGHFNISDDVIYTLIGKDNLFIRNDIVDLKDQKPFTKVIYNRPLCSVVELQNKASISMRYRTILKYDEDFTVRAVVNTRISDASREENEGKKFFIAISYVPEPTNMTKDQDNHKDKDSKTGKLENVGRVTISIEEGFYNPRDSLNQDKKVPRRVVKFAFDSLEELSEDAPQHYVNITNGILHMDLKSKLSDLLASEEKASTDKAQRIVASTGEAQTNGASTGEAQTNGASTGEVQTNGVSSEEAQRNEAQTNEEAQTNGASTGEAQTNGASTGEAQTNGASTGEVQTNGVSSEEKQANEVSTEEVQTNGASTGEAQTNGASTGEAQTNGASTGEVQTNGVSSEEAQTTKVSTEETLTEKAP